MLDALIPCHAMPLADVLMLMTDARRGARPCACACFAGNSSSHMSFVLHSSSPTVHSSAAASRALALITHTRHAASDWNSGLPGLSAHCSHPWKSRLRAILVRMLGAPVSKRRFPNTAAHARPCPYPFQSVGTGSWWRWTVEGRRDFSFPYPGSAQPGAFIRIYFSSLVLLRWLLRAACYATTLRYAWPDWRRAAPKRSQPTGPPFPTEQVKLVNQLSPLTRFSRAF
jgi:hypothetical protein